MLTVTICRWVAYDQNGACYAKRVVLPCPPFVGLGYVADVSVEPAKIEEVFVDGPDVVCVLESQDYDAGDMPPDEWQEQLAWLTEGWTPIGRWPRPLPSAEVRPPPS